MKRITLPEHTHIGDDEMSKLTNMQTKKTTEQTSPHMSSITLIERKRSAKRDDEHAPAVKRKKIVEKTSSDVGYVYRHQILS